MEKRRKGYRKSTREGFWAFHYWGGSEGIGKLSKIALRLPYFSLSGLSLSGPVIRKL
jgi:hypothetical protein